MRFIATALLLASGSALACPQLEGKYASCQKDPATGMNEYRLQITQRTWRRITTFTMTSVDLVTGEKEIETYKTDGKTYVINETDPDSGVTVSMSTTASCTSDSLNTVMVLSYEGEAFSKVTSTFRKDGNKLLQFIKEDDQKEYKVICE